MPTVVSLPNISKLQPCLLKRPLNTETKLKELESMY